MGVVTVAGRLMLHYDTPGWGSDAICREGCLITGGTRAIPSPPANPCTCGSTASV